MSKALKRRQTSGRTQIKPETEGQQNQKVIQALGLNPWGEPRFYGFHPAFAHLKHTPQNRTFADVINWLPEEYDGPNQEYRGSPGEAVAEWSSFHRGVRLW